MNYVTLKENLESAAGLYTAAQIKAALAFAGTQIQIFRPKEELVTDTVYGVYSGSDLRENKSYSIYDTELEDEIIDISADETSTSNEVLYSYYDPAYAIALITANTWRQIDEYSLGFIEDPLDLWVDSESDIQPKDVIEITRNIGESIRFKVISVKTIGSSVNVAKKIQLSNIGD